MKQLLVKLEANYRNNNTELDDIQDKQNDNVQTEEVINAIHIWFSRYNQQQQTQQHQQEQQEQHQQQQQFIEVYEKAVKECLIKIQNIHKYCTEEDNSNVINDNNSNNNNNNNNNNNKSIELDVELQQQQMLLKSTKGFLLDESVDCLNMLQLVNPHDITDYLKQLLDFIYKFRLGNNKIMHMK